MRNTSTFMDVRFRSCSILHDVLTLDICCEAEMPVHGPAVAAAIRARLGSGVEPESSVMHLDESEHQMALALDSGREML